MFKLQSKIVITQLPRDKFPTRKSSFTMTFLNDIEIISSWNSLTDTAKVKFPKRVYFIDEAGRKVSWFGKNVIALSANPLVMRGDRIDITLGYFGFPQVEEFSGYITEVNNRVPLEIECQDAMFLMKQIHVKNRVYLAKDFDIDTIVKDMMNTAVLPSSIADKSVESYIQNEIIRLNLKDNILTGTSTSIVAKTNVGDFRTQNDTIASTLDRFKKDYRVFSYFRKNSTGQLQLRCSPFVYWPQDIENKKFAFQKNIHMGDQLEYKRLDDLQLGAKAYSLNKVNLMQTNKNGSQKTKRERLEIFVGSKSGEIRTLYYWNVFDVKKLEALATADLAKFYYEGFRGSFTTFGFPSVQHGMVALISDAVLPERDGAFFIKSVTKRFGMNGYKQMIDLHFKYGDASGVSLFSPDQINAGL